MERKLSDGDYVPDGKGGFTLLSGGQEVLARVLFRLQTRRGSLPFLPELGSYLYQIPHEKPSDRQALCCQYVAQALQPEPDLHLQNVEWRDSGDSGQLTVRLSWKGQPLTASLTL